MFYVSLFLHQNFFEKENFFARHFLANSNTHDLRMYYPLSLSVTELSCVYHTLCANHSSTLLYNYLLIYYVIAITMLLKIARMAIRKVSFSTALSHFQFAVLYLLFGSFSFCDQAATSTSAVRVKDS